MIAFDYWKVCELVLKAPDVETAFEDYAALLKTCVTDSRFRIDGTPREGLEWRTEMGVSSDHLLAPKDQGEFLAFALMCASHYGITLPQLIDLFDATRPRSGVQALCVVEDAICILERFSDG